MHSIDQDFKNIIVDYSLQAIELYAPEEFAKLPRGAVFTPIRQEQLKERLGDSFRELDVPLLATFPDGSSEALIFIFENESSDRKQFLHYLGIVTLQISMMMKTTRVVPVAVHPFRKKRLQTSLKIGGNARNFMDFSCLSCCIGTMKARDHEQSDNIVARMCLPLMNYNPSERLLVITRAYEGLESLESDQSRRIKYAGFISHYAELQAHEEPEFYSKYVRNSKHREGIMTLYDILHGRGKTEGKIEGQVELVMQFFKDGTLTAQKARAKLKTLGKGKGVAKELVKTALEKIDASKA